MKPMYYLSSLTTIISMIVGMSYGVLMVYVFSKCLKIIDKDEWSIRKRIARCLLILIPSSMTITIYLEILRNYIL